MKLWVKYKKKDEAESMGLMDGVVILSWDLFFSLLQRHSFQQSDLNPLVFLQPLVVCSNLCAMERICGNLH
jgi:hypothetical protein